MRWPLIAFGAFIALVLLLCWWLLRFGTKEYDRIYGLQPLDQDTDEGKGQEAPRPEGTEEESDGTEESGRGEGHPRA